MRRRLAFVALLLLGTAARAEAEIDLFVAPGAAPSPCGNGATFARITDALACARCLRLASGDAIVVHVAAGTYRGSYDPAALAANPALEVLPLVINVSDLALEGETVLRLDKGGLPADVAAQGDTLITADAALGASQALILVGRTTDGMAGDGVSVSGLDLDGHDGDAFPTFSYSSAVVADRVSGVSISGNAVHGSWAGIVMRHASGEIAGNLARGCVAGIDVEGGTASHPTVVTAEGNRSVTTVAIGAIAVPVAVDVDLGANPLAVLPIALDPSVAGANAVTLTLLGNAADGTNIGLRFLAIPRGPQPIPPTAYVSIVASGNSFAGHFYGVSIDAGFDYAGFPPLSLECQATFSGNTYNKVGLPPALIAFSYPPMLIAGAYQYLTTSTYVITDTDGELAGFDYDDPGATAAQGALGNTLLVGPARAWLSYAGTKIEK
jgi:hypothetical protein